MTVEVVKINLFFVCYINRHRTILVTYCSFYSVSIYRQYWVFDYCIYKVFEDHHTSNRNLRIARTSRT